MTDVPCTSGFETRNLGVLKKAKLSAFEADIKAMTELDARDLIGGASLRR
jgi:hypothetical protein